jgi:thymidylate synthase (FAD)
MEYTKTDELEFEIISAKKVMELLPENYDEHVMCAVKFICNRAISHELVRHRPCSWIQESQRYCNYSKTQFGKEVTFISPDPFFSESDSNWDIWEQAMADAEEKYFLLLNGGATPQAARTVLPNSCKTELICFATIAQWEHMFNLRLASGAEPSMQFLMKQVADSFYNKKYLWE